MNRSHYLLRELGIRLKGVPGMTLNPARILIVAEEGEQYGEPLASILPGCRFTLKSCPEAAKRYFLSSPNDLVILDHSPRLSCLELLPVFKAQHPSVPVVVLTGCGSEELAVQAFRHGAIDYFRKPFAVEDLGLSIRAVLEIRIRNRQSDKPLPVSGLQRALRYMGKNFHAPMCLEDAAREAGMSVSCFERYLKNQTGMTFTTYLNSLRIARAKELLQADHAPMLQIALVCGFGNQSHFNRVFRKVTGTSPGVFRKGASSRD